jgi:hypothetical protein
MSLGIDSRRPSARQWSDRRNVEDMHTRFFKIVRKLKHQPSIYQGALAFMRMIAVARSHLVEERRPVSCSTGDQQIRTSDASGKCFGIANYRAGTVSGQEEAGS